MTAVEQYAVGCGNELYTEYDLYGYVTPLHQEVVKSAWSRIKGLLSSIPFTPGYGPFVICDYGTADGINSISLITNCINWVQKTYGEDQQVHIIYEDQPTNDFNTLIHLLEGGGLGSYLQDLKNVFVTCCGRSFYKQCLPDASVHLGFSISALSWLSKCPSVTSPEVISLHFAEGSPEQRMFMEQSARDWENFLLNRAKELVSGGRLLISILSSECCPCTKTGAGVWCFFKSMTDIWIEMMHEELISEDEFLRTIMPDYFPKTEELSVAFEDNSTVTKSGLQLIAMETQTIERFWQERWLTSTKQDSTAAIAHAESCVQSLRSPTNRIFTRGLSREKNLEERNRIIDEFYRRLVEQVAKAPAERGFKIVNSVVSVAKTDVI